MSTPSARQEAEQIVRFKLGITMYECSDGTYRFGTNQVDPLIDALTTALLAAEQRGRMAGLEEAAALLEHEGYRLEHNVPADMWVPKLYAKELRRRLTALRGEAGT